MSRKRFHIDWVALLVNTTLTVAAVMLVALLGFAAWVITH